MDKLMDEQPQWQPISMLLVFTDMVDGMLEASQEQLDNMQLAREKPHIMDDATLQRVVELYTNQLEDHRLFEEQFTRWLQQNLTSEQTREIERLQVQATALKACNEQILEITENIRGSTIDSVMGMDEFELIDALLLGKLKPPV
tara:strand:+ start:127 stop:558 length:432 start_codon:yes stop_codon:yes gene_type:complete